MARTLRLVIPALWMGIVIALGFIETPLKFLAPGITLDVALGIGRLVLTAENIASGVLLVALTLAALVRHRPARASAVALGALWIVVAAQIAVIRPLLNARSDIRIAGGDPGPSSLHVVYIVADLLIIALLLLWIVVEHRAQRTIPPIERP